MYQVLYRKYRPKIFDDVVGQEHITSTLQNEVKANKLSHAYLFTGSRGTGKTTCAKILSKAVNCLAPVDGNPCNECEICRGIESGAILDVVEIDAASNNGVDNIRDIRDEANFAPAACKFRVYIIDEVHMLSIGAFNALLKTLEEPPEHVKFILATTEVQKLPVTILSRCQRFDFKRVSTESMKKRIDFIASRENFSVDDDAALLISRLADGGMRDALSMLDRCISQSDNVTVDVVSSVAGLTGKAHLFDLSAQIGSFDASKALSLINDLYANSFDMERLCSELIAHFRALMIVKTVKNAENVLVCTADEIEEYRRQGELFSLNAVINCIDVFQAALANIKQGVNRRTELELAVIKLCSEKKGSDISALSERLAALEKRISSGNIGAVASSGVSSPGPRKPEKAKSAPSAPPAEVPAVDGELREWGKVLNYLKENNKPLWSAMTDTSAYVRNGTLIIRCDDPTFLFGMMRRDKNNTAVLTAIYFSIGMKLRKLDIELSSGGDMSPPDATAEENKKSRLDLFLEKAKENGVDVSVE